MCTVHHLLLPQGFSTTKGELVRSILFPPPLDFKFHSDFVKSIYVFLTLGLIGMSYSLYIWTKKGVRDGVSLDVCRFCRLHVSHS